MGEMMYFTAIHSSPKISNVSGMPGVIYGWMPDLCRITSIGQGGRFELASLRLFTDSPWRSWPAVKDLPNAPTLRRLADHHYHERMLGG